MRTTVDYTAPAKTVALCDQCYRAVEAGSPPAKLDGLTLGHFEQWRSVEAVAGPRRSCDGCGGYAYEYDLFATPPVLTIVPACTSTRSAGYGAESVLCTEPDGHDGPHDDGAGARW